MMKGNEKYGVYAVFVLIRLVIVPAVIIFSIKAWKASSSHPSVFDKDPLLTLVLLLESAEPSAQIIMVTISRLGLFSISDQVAPLYLIMYVLSSITLVVWCSISLSIAYGT